MKSPSANTLRSLPTALCALTGLGIGAEAATANPAETLLAFEPAAAQNLPVTTAVPAPDAPIIASAAVSTSATALLETPVGLQAIPDRGLELAQTGRRRRRRTVRRTAPAENYIGIGFNVGVSDDGDSALGTENVALFSRLKLARRFSLRPAVIIGDDAVFTFPATFDIPLRGRSPQLLAKPAPEVYVGGGLLFGIDDDDSNEIGGAIVGGVDFPFAKRFVANASLTLGLSDGDSNLGALFGIAYRFPRR